MKQIMVILLIMFFAQVSCFAQFHEGDTANFWSVSYVDWPPLQGTPQREVDATCKKEGVYCYVFVENGVAQPSSEVLDSLVKRFDTRWYDSLTKVYGSVPDVFDDDPKIFILVLDESNWSGYFDPAQQMADSAVYHRWNRHSSQREILYLSASASDNFDNIVTHEFGHMLHWLQDHSPHPVVSPIRFWDEAWIDEGFSTFATIYLMENIHTRNVLENAPFFAFNPDIPLIYFSDYNQVKLFMLFMYEHYGRWDYIHALIGNPFNGIDGVNNTLSQLGYSEMFDDAFERWAIANFIDDLQYDGGRYGYSHYNFPACALSATHASFPVETRMNTISPYGVDYVLFTASTPKPLVVDFAGHPESRYRLSLILRGDAGIDSVISIPLDASNRAQFEIDSLGASFTQAIMVVMNVDSAMTEGNSAPYHYSAVLKKSTEGMKDLVLLFPNPVNDRLNVVIPNNDQKSVMEIHDMEGRLEYQSVVQGNSCIDVSGLSRGVYVVRVVCSSGTFLQKLLVE